MLDGDADAKILFVSDFQRINCGAEGRVLGEQLHRVLDYAIKQAGLRSADYAMCVLHPRVPAGGKDAWRIPAEQRDADLASFKQLLAGSSANVVVPLGEYAFEQICGFSGLHKWHSNVVRLKAEYGARKCVPLLHPEHVFRNYGDSFYLAFGCGRLVAEKEFPEVREIPRKFLLSPSFDATLSYLEDVVAKADKLAVDIETGQGQINTVGFAVSPTEAIAIKCLPEHYPPEQYLKLWQVLARILEGPQPKILQNFIYEATWFARYGIQMRAVCFDTMWAQKFLHPELEKGLDNVGRLYTPYPYWKDDNDDWSNIRDWPRHLDYNCKDTTGTFAGYLGQSAALRERELAYLFASYVMRFSEPIYEMCTRGLRVDPAALIKLQEKLEREKENYETILGREFEARLGRPVNPRSPKQLQAGLKGIGLKLPTKRAKLSGEQTETADKKALIKLRRKYPNEPVLPALIGLSSANKQLSSYVDFEYDRGQQRVHYTLDGCGTETGRWAGYNSGWGEGFNPQTVPKSVRNCFIADPGKVLVQVDLAQAESRYVAWEAPEPALMQMILEKRDVHKFVASRVLKKPEEFINYAERQLGKKTGHAKNYDVGVRTFCESVLVELGQYLEEHEGRRILGGYDELFPGIRTRKANIRKELCQKRMLRTPIGRERYFYGRMDDATFREAYAYAPQSVIPDITNHLLLKLWGFREELECEFLLQVHDSLLLQCPPERVAEIADLCRDLRAWHPKINLPGGELWIPVEVEAGERWGKLEPV